MVVVFLLKASIHDCGGEMKENAPQQFAILISMPTIKTKGLTGK
jgi:hypothetical protein